VEQELGKLIGWRHMYSNNGIPLVNPPHKLDQLEWTVADELIIIYDHESAFSTRAELIRWSNLCAQKSRPRLGKVSSSALALDWLSSGASNATLGGGATLKRAGRDGGWVWICECMHDTYHT
jgi:hypothetical protein